MDEHIHVATDNCQKFNWRSLLGRPKLIGVLETARTAKWDVVLLSELAESSMDPVVVYIEEFVLIACGRVGVLLHYSARKAWLAAGGTMKVIHERAIAVPLNLRNGASYVAASIYVPTGWDAEARVVRRDLYEA
eukprot:16447310-Heterocapsa_arctica.AAC.1